MGGRGDDSLQWIPIDFSFCVKKSHAALIGATVFFLVRSPEDANPPATVASQPLLTKPHCERRRLTMTSGVEQITASVSLCE